MHMCVCVRVCRAVEGIDEMITKLLQYAEDVMVRLVCV